VIDFDAKMLRPSKDSLVTRFVRLKNVERVENKMVMQGVDEGVEGVDDGVAYIVFGVCTPIKGNR
jgi:hypothetical protein